MSLGSVVAIGRRAATLVRHGANARVLAPLTASIYIVVRAEILWLGGPDDALHPRAILLSKPPPAAYAAGDLLRIPPSDTPAWCPAPIPVNGQAAAALRRGTARLAAVAAGLGRPVGFGARLAGAPLAFPLAGAAARADALAAACADDDPARAATAALALLGVGAGLTPSGDDFVGGAFFARASLGQADVREPAGWDAAAATVCEAATRSTHPISAALLGDLLAGEGWAPLHTLARALASDDAAASRDAAKRLIGLGHSSGWDLLAGFAAGLPR